jgi:hypothetical protein
MTCPKEIFKATADHALMICESHVPASSMFVSIDAINLWR